MMRDDEDDDAPPRKLDFTPPDWAPGQDEVAGYLELILDCAEPARLAGIAEFVGRELAPQQLRRLYQLVETRAKPNRVAAFRARAPGWQMFLSREPPIFLNTRISGCARLFEAGGAVRANKTLLVLFAGRGGEAFIPTSRLLARLPLWKFDVLRLRAEADEDYIHGVPGIGRSFFEVCAHLATRLPGYAGNAAMGTSLGGFAALRAAVLANLHVAASLSGRFTAFRIPDGKRDPPGYDPLCGCTPHVAAKLLAYYAADHRIDTLQSRRLATLCPTVRLIAVPGGQSHNVVAQMVATGTLNDVFKDLLTASLAPKRR